jgi:hypothetical protein
MIDLKARAIATQHYDLQTGAVDYPGLGHYDRGDRQVNPPEAFGLIGNVDIRLWLIDV